MKTTMSTMSVRRRWFPTVVRTITGFEPRPALDASNTPRSAERIDAHTEAITDCRSSVDEDDSEALARRVEAGVVTAGERRALEAASGRVCIESVRSAERTRCDEVVERAAAVPLTDA